MPDTSFSLQIDILTLMAFSTEDALYLRRLVAPSDYTSIHARRIASVIHDFIDQYQCAPQSHLGDLFRPFVGPEAPEESKEAYEMLYSKIIAKRKSTSAKYVRSKVEEYLLAKQLSDGMQKINELYKNEKWDDLVHNLRDLSRVRRQQRDLGLVASNYENFLTQEDIVSKELVIGEPYLEEEGFTIERATLMLVMGGPAVGKTWSVVHTGVENARIGKKVLHVSLEMSQNKCLIRYLRNIGKLTYDRGKEISYKVIRKIEDDNYYFKDCCDRFMGRNDPGVVEWLSKYKDVLGNIVIKKFPTQVLTVHMLENYLDDLDSEKGFVPDVLIVDYPELFKMSNNKTDRRDVYINEMYEELRRIGEIRNIAVVCPTKATRQGIESEHMAMSHMAESVAKDYTADRILAIQATPQELKDGIRRLSNLKNRDGKPGTGVVITTNLDAGQWVTASAPYVPEQYKNLLAGKPDTWDDK